MSGLTNYTICRMWEISFLNGNTLYSVSFYDIIAVSIDNGDRE
jgi:hypothetical protein